MEAGCSSARTKLVLRAVPRSSIFYSFSFFSFDGENYGRKEPVTTGIFPVNQHPAVVLFDSRSSHSFISQAFAQKHDQSVTELSYGYRISSAGAGVLTNLMVHGVTLDIGDQRFGVNLVVMPGLVLDVIVGMN